jgi:ribosomal protein S27E
MNFQIKTIPSFIEDLGMLPMGNQGRVARKWIVECPYCKKEYIAFAHHIKSGQSSKCKSCSIRIIRTSHGGSYSRLFSIWVDLKRRCINKKRGNYKDYGGRGISVCDEWMNDFKTFNDWALANGYSDKLSIDRKNNDGNYEPDNCRWATNSIQGQNSRKIRANNTSGYRGICLSKNKKRWVAKIVINSESIYLGTFDTDVLAAHTYDNYVIENNLEHTRNF